MAMKFLPANLSVVHNTYILYSTNQFYIYIHLFCLFVIVRLVLCKNELLFIISITVKSSATDTLDVDKISILMLINSQLAVLYSSLQTMVNIFRIPLELRSIPARESLLDNTVYLSNLACSFYQISQSSHGTDNN